MSPSTDQQGWQTSFDVDTNAVLVIGRPPCMGLGFNVLGDGDLVVVFKVIRGIRYHLDIVRGQCTPVVVLHEEVLLVNKDVMKVFVGT